MPLGNISLPKSYVVCAAVIALTSMSVVASAADFRIVNRVYLDSEKEPAHETVTLVQGSFICDIFGDEDEAIVVDLARDCVHLLDGEKKLHAQISLEEIQGHVDLLWSVKNPNEGSFTKFVRNPLFQESFDDGSGDLALKSPFIVYSVKTSPVQPDVAKVYRAFADIMAKMNCVLDEMALPPNSRMKLDQFLERRNRLPREVRMTIRPPKVRPIRLRSEHDLQIGLNEDDLRAIDGVQTSLKTFHMVSFEDYRKMTTSPE